MQTREQKFSRFAVDYDNEELFDAAVAAFQAAGITVENGTYNNDTCPKLVVADEIDVFVEYADPALRESQAEGGPFFLWDWRDGREAGYECATVAETVALVRALVDPSAEDRLARMFALTLRRELGDLAVAQIVERNMRDPYRGNACASHDFCDANMVMLAAFNATLDREPTFLGNGDGETDPDAKLWSAAWSQAKASGFLVRPSADREDLDAEARAFMDRFPDWPKASLDEWLLEHNDALSEEDRAEGAAILARYSENGGDDR